MEIIKKEHRLSKSLTILVWIIGISFSIYLISQIIFNIIVE